jgi:glycyl-tRNA synthetase
MAGFLYTKGVIFKNMSENSKPVTLEQIVSFCKRRGFVFPSSEIYGGFAAVYDFGPYGVTLAKNIREAWWQAMVGEHQNIVGLDSAIFMHPKVWEASGHVTGFSDPLVECKKCQTRSRVDHLLEEKGVEADEKMTEAEINALFDEHKKDIVCPKCGKSDWSAAKSFNLLVESNLGNFTGDDEQKVYLRGETCQGIYVNFKNVLDSTRVKVPFGIAQIGKAFRNEITARQFIFRKREFEQMEMQFFVTPESVEAFYEEWKEKRFQYYLDLGIKKENLRWKSHENLVFYAKAAFDIEYNFPFGFKELEGIHNRSDYDLTQHSKFSGVDLSYRDPQTNEKYTPWVIETSVGLDRTFLAVLTEAYTEESLEGDDVRLVMKFPKKLAPVQVAVFPLLKNKPELAGKAEEIFNGLRKHFRCEFDDNGNVGKRYRRQDEIGTPYCVTVDFETLENDTVTVRDRDTMEQTRVAVADLISYIQ